MLVSFFFLPFAFAAGGSTGDLQQESVVENATDSGNPMDLKAGDVEKEFPEMQVDAQKEFHQMEVDASKEFPDLQVNAAGEFPNLEVDARKEFSGS